MKRSISLVIIFSLVFSVVMLSQTKKFDLKGSTSTKTTASTATKDTTTTTKSTAATTAVSAKPANLPALPPGVKRVDVNVLQEEYFECPKCKKEFAKAGKCPVHNVALIKKTRSYTFKCKLCGYTSEKDGKCPSCKGNPPLRKFEVTYQDVGCKEISSEPGKCPKCKQDLKKTVIVELKK